MLYLLAEWLNFEGIFNLVRYQTWPATLMTALIIGLVIGPRFIAMLRVRQARGADPRGWSADPPRQAGYADHGRADDPDQPEPLGPYLDGPEQPFIWACLAVTLGFGLIGFLDDYDKVSKASHKGVSGKVRLLLNSQLRVELHRGERGQHLPLRSLLQRHRSNKRIPAFAAFVIVVQCGQSDRRPRRAGDDAGDHRRGTFALIAYLVGRVDYSDYLGIPYVEGQANWRSSARQSWVRGSPSCGSTRPRRPL